MNLDSLVGKTNLKAIKRALNHLPTGSDALDSAYKDAIDRIESQSPERCNLAKKALIWITYAKELLSIKELEQAVAIELGQSDLDQENVCDYEDIVSVCAGLVIADFDDVYPGGFLRLAHYTTQEHLVRNGMKYFPEAQQIMASSCLTYLLYDAFSGTSCNARRDPFISEQDEILCFGCNICLNDEERGIWNHTGDKDVFDSWRTLDVCNDNLVHRYPFHRYAAWHWGFHSAKSNQDLVQHLTSSLLNDPNRVLGIYAFLQHDASNAFRLCTEARNVHSGLAMHLVAFLGLPEVVSRLLEDGIAPDTEDWRGWTPLEVAIERGFADVSELLVKCCDINHRSTLERITPLMAAVRQDNAAIVQQLLAHRYIEVNVQNSTGSTALHNAILWGYPQIMKLLLAHNDIDITIQDMLGKAPIHQALQSWLPGMSQLLLARDDVKINVRDEQGETPIYQAVKMGNAEVVRLLLAREDLKVGTDNGEVEELISAAETKIIARRKVKYEEITKLLRSHFRLEQGPVTTSET